MNSKVLTYIGIVLMVSGGTEMSMQLGFSGPSSALWAIFAIGIVLVARDPVRQLSERVRVLEADLAHYRSAGQGSQ